MNAPIWLLYPRLYWLTRGYRPTEAQMPLSYQNVPGGRPLHDDWAIFKSTPRIDSARRIPLPLRQISGACIPTWIVWDVDYPRSPNLQVEEREYYPGKVFPHALVDYAGDGWSMFAFWHHDRWIPCVWQYKRTINIPFMGRRVLKFYHGLKQDVTVGVPNEHHSYVKSDLMGWLEPAMSLTKES